jgi:hypothetical protein
VERDWSGNARRLSKQIDLRSSGSSGAGRRSRQQQLPSAAPPNRPALSGPNRGSQAADKGPLAAAPVAGGARGDFARLDRWRLPTRHREATAEGTFDDLSRRGRSGSPRRYRAWRADSEAIERGRRPKPAKLAIDSRLCREVERGSSLGWSPQQIAARLICDYPDDLNMRVSHETIYKTLFI